MKGHSIIVLVSCSRVTHSPSSDWLDLPELTSIQMGSNAFQFKDEDSSELIMQSDSHQMSWSTRLAQTHQSQRRRLRVQVPSPHYSWEWFAPTRQLSLDIPNLVNVTLPTSAFQNRRSITVNRTRCAFALPSEIAFALQQHLTENAPERKEEKTIASEPIDDCCSILLSVSCTS